MWGDGFRMNEIVSQLMSRETDVNVIDINGVNVIVNDISCDAAAAAAAASGDKSCRALAGSLVVT